MSRCPATLSFLIGRATAWPTTSVSWKRWKTASFTPWKAIPGMYARNGAIHWVQPLCMASACPCIEIREMCLTMRRVSYGTTGIYHLVTLACINLHTTKKSIVDVSRGAAKLAAPHRRSYQREKAFIGSPGMVLALIPLFQKLLRAIQS